MARMQNPMMIGSGRLSTLGGDIGVDRGVMPTPRTPPAITRPEEPGYQFGTPGLPSNYFGLAGGVPITMGSGLMFNPRGYAPTGSLLQQLENIRLQYLRSLIGRFIGGF